MQTNYSFQWVATKMRSWFITWFVLSKPIYCMEIAIPSKFLTTEYIIHIDGLTHIGSEYAHHMKGALWNKAIDWCKKQGIPLTTKVAVKYVMDALGGEG